MYFYKNTSYPSSVRINKYSQGIQEAKVETKIKTTTFTLRKKHSLKAVYFRGPINSKSCLRK